MYDCVLYVVLEVEVNSLPSPLSPVIPSQSARDDVRLTSLSSLMDLGLFTSLLVAGTTIHVGWSFSLRIFRTFQTQVHDVYGVCVSTCDRKRVIS